jgi:hypothetical protein
VRQFDASVDLYSSDKSLHFSLRLLRFIDDLTVVLIQIQRRIKLRLLLQKLFQAATAYLSAVKIVPLLIS